MKTNTYGEFKEYVVNNCVKNQEGKDYAVYHGDSAHLIYSAWYMFKHNLTPEQCQEYLKKDYEATRKHFSSHGGYAYVEIIKNDAVPEIITYPSGWKQQKYKESDFLYKASTSITGGIYYKDYEDNWIKGVMDFYNFWKKKLDNELNAAQ